MLISFLSLLMCVAFANDGASSGPASGLILQKQENVQMKKEVLKISLSEISVDYIFENKSDKDIEAFVQFPLPIELDDYGGRFAAYDPHFSLNVDGKKVAYQITRKIYGAKDLQKDLTETLKTKGYLKGDAAEWVQSEDQWSETQKKELIAIGVLDYAGQAQWYSQRIFYWSQKFAAKQELKVHHDYRPISGGSIPNAKGLNDSCADDAIIKGVRKKSSGGYSYVDYILTTANTWKTPIEDFTLIVQKPDAKTIMSTCFDGLQKSGPREFQVKKINFVPKSELRIYFFDHKSRE